MVALCIEIHEEGLIVNKIIQICPIILKVYGNPCLKKAPLVCRVPKMVFYISKGPADSYKSLKGPSPVILKTKIKSGAFLASLTCGNTTLKHQERLFKTI